MKVGEGGKQKQEDMKQRNNRTGHAPRASKFRVVTKLMGNEM